MRIKTLFVALFLTVLAAPAMAGTVSYADMRGKWQTTGCTAPQALIVAGRDSETPANELNAQIAERNKFVNEASAYMNCISAEAQRDADALGVLVTQTAKAIIDKTQAEVDAAMATPTPPPSAATK